MLRLFRFGRKIHIDDSKIVDNGPTDGYNGNIKQNFSRCSMHFSAICGFLAVSGVMKQSWASRRDGVQL